MNRYLEHIGLITESRNGQIKVSLIGSGCSACHSSLCMLGESKAKELKLLHREGKFAAGEEVVVRINPASGYTAVVLLYLVPFFLMMVVLFGVSSSGYSEVVAGVAALVILGPYFLVLYGLQSRIKQTCKIEIAKR